jgi:hypothetical protein
MMHKINVDLNECSVDDIFRENDYSHQIQLLSIFEADKDETCNEKNCVPFVGQIFLSEEAFPFIKDMFINKGSQYKKVVS